MTAIDRAVLLWLAIGVGVLLCGELYALKHSLHEGPANRPSMGERVVVVVLWPFAILVTIHAWWAVRRDMRAMHGDDDPPR